MLNSHTKSIVQLLMDEQKQEAQSCNLSDKAVTLYLCRKV